MPLLLLLSSSQSLARAFFAVAIGSGRLISSTNMSTHSNVHTHSEDSEASHVAAALDG